MKRCCLFVIFFLTLNICQGQTTYTFTDGLGAGPCHQYGREAIFTDLLAHQLIQGKLVPPAEGGILATDKQGNPIKWQRVKADTTRRLRDASLGNGYLYLNYTSSEEKTALFHALGHAGLFFNGAPFSGDMYRHEYLFHPVKIKKGVNEIYVRMGFGGRFQGLMAELIFPEKSIFISTKDSTLPHILIEKTTESLLGGIVLINLTEKPLENLTLKATIEGNSATTNVPIISQMTTRKVPFKMNVSNITQKGDVVCTLTLLDNNKVLDEKTLVLKVISEKEHHSSTFISAIDGSVQYYAVAPQTGDPTPESALFLSVHGAGVEAIGQARAYKSKDWGILVAPTNRRPRGFNWEEWGRMDALEVLNIATKRFNPNPQKIYLTGHSMGGHGSWYLGATYPGKWAGIAPCAGYPTLMGYGSADGKIPTHSDNKVEQMLLRASNPSNVVALAKNYKASGIYILHGDADRTVSVEYAREMRKVLSGFHNDFSYYEYPNGSHWYGDESVDWKPLFDFFKWHNTPKSEHVDTLNFTTANPAISSTYHWAGIEQQEAPFSYSNIQVRRNKDKKQIEVKTENVRMVKLLPAVFPPDEPFKVIIDGVEVCTTCKTSGNTLFFVKNQTWEPSDAPTQNQRSATRNGSFKEGFNHKMVFVYGTDGSKEENEWAWQKAVVDAETWYYRGNGAVDIVADKDFTPSLFADRGVILFGNANTNSAWKMLLANSPLQVQKGSVKIGDETITGDDLGVYFSYPRADSRFASVSVIAGTGILGMKATFANQYFAAGSGFPDYLIFNADLLQNGAKSIKATGFFDNNWQFSKKDAALGAVQDLPRLKWWKPSDSPFPTVDGQFWTSEMQDSLFRLPPRAEVLVRKPVWNLAKNSAGLFIRFVSNAPQITVRYKVSGNVAMSHMPATGVSGVDLYAIDSEGEWHSCAGKFNFKDTITYTFEKLKINDGYHKLGREYRLFLPLYNTIRQLEIGVPDSALFRPLAKMREKPIVVYGTSIAQGACASRPAMAWTNIISRTFDRPVINLAFSGNGQLEKELIDLINEIDAKVYVLDCLPNLVAARFDSTEVRKRIMESVKSIRQKYPTTPILLTDHAGYTEGYLMPERQKLFEAANKNLAIAFAQLQKEGITNIFTLKIGEIRLDLDAMVDGTHPNDYGMMQYAKAYETKLREIMNEPKGNFITQVPVRQRREPASYEWEKRHYDILDLNKTEPSKIVFIGNSITHNWGGKPINNRIRGANSWQKYLEPLQVRNFGFGWDRVENVLWRIYHEALEGISPEKIVLNIGTNNLHLNTDEEIAEGLNMLIRAIKIRQPQAEIYVLGIYPRRGKEERVAGLNLKIKQMAQSAMIQYADVGAALLLDTKKINEKLFSDGLHPNAEGYEILGKALSELLR
jgi:lysophospholipase L1-like esterase/predicted esterase